MKGRQQHTQTRPLPTFPILWEINVYGWNCGMKKIKQGNLLESTQGPSFILLFIKFVVVEREREREREREKH